jgi:hypothetical protein
MLPVSETDIQVVFDIYMKNVSKISENSYRVNFIDFIQEFENTHGELYKSIPINYMHEIQNSFHHIILKTESRMIAQTSVPEYEQDEINGIVQRLYNDHMSRQTRFVEIQDD